MKIEKNRVSNKLGTHFLNFIDKVILMIILFLVLIFIFFPMISVISESFIVNGKFTLDIYKSLLNKNIILLKNSLFVAILTTIISTLLSIAISIYISFTNSKYKKILTTILMLTMISPPFVSSLAYISLFGRRGFITHNILGLTVNTYGWQGIVAMQSLGFTSLNALMLIGFINGMDKSLFNSSLDLGGNSSYTIAKIVIPLMRPGIIVVGLLTFVRSLADFSTPIIIGGSFNVLATQAYLNVVAYSDLPMAAAISILLFIPAIIAFILYRIFLKDSNIITGTNFREESSETMLRIEGFFPRVLQIITYLFLIMMILQYLSIFISAMTKQKFGTVYFTFDNIKESKNYISGSFIRSVLYSLIAGVVGSIIGFLISYYLEIRKIKGMKIIDFISTMPYIIPGTFFGLGYILAFNKYPLALTGTGLIVILNCIFKQLPLPTKASSAVISQINPQVTEASKDLGAHNMYVLKDVIIPMSKSAFLISFVNNFTTTMTTIGSIIFLVYPGKKLATLVMFDAIQSGKYRIGSVIACMIILITLFVNIIFSKFLLEERNVY